MRMPGQKPPKKEVKDPLRDLMKQMGLKMGPDIMEETKTQDDAGGAKVVKLPPHDGSELSTDRPASTLSNMRLIFGAL